MKIVLLEDNQEICECVTAVLELTGHQVSAYTTGAELLNSFFESPTIAVPPYDLVIVDLNLPGKLTGQDVITIFRSTASTKNLPLLIISGASEYEIAGVRRLFPSIPLLRKPFALRALIQLVNEYLYAPAVSISYAGS